MPRLKQQQLKDVILAQNPSQEQENAIFTEQREFLLKACPGSGKTWTTCRRFLWRVFNWEYESGGLAMLSFTKTAVKEFKLATAQVGRGALTEPHFVGTLDSFIERFILGPFGHLITGGNKRPKLFHRPRPGDLNNKKLTVKVQTSKGGWMTIGAWDIHPKKLGQKMFFIARVPFEIPLGDSSIGAINELFRSRGEYAHQHRAFWAGHLLRRVPRVAEIVAKRFSEIIIDEAQDTGAWLVDVIRELRKAGVKVTVVGDPDQCIYEFGQASFSTLAELKSDWNLDELPLNKSFRCNDRIATAVRSIGGNHNFEGRGPARSEFEGAFVFADSTEGFAAAITSFRKRIGEAGLKESDCAILCRAHDQIEKVRGVVRYKVLKGRTRRMAEAAYLRDALGDFAGAAEVVTEVLQEIIPNEKVWEAMADKPATAAAAAAKLSVWKFVRSDEGLPSLSEGGAKWVEKLRVTTTSLFKALGIVNVPSLSVHFKNTGLGAGEMQLPLFGVDSVLPDLRFDTIHQAKGESIDGVLVTGSKKFFESLMKDVIAGEASEDRRLAYVAMTRAVHLLYVVVPAEHLLKHRSFWSERGFVILN